jgi:arsenic resistance protein ArsH
MAAPDLSDLPNIDFGAFEAPTTADLLPQPLTHPPRLLLLYGSLRERSFSRFQAQEAARLLETFGAETRIYNPSGLPLPDDAPADHPKVAELRELSAWSEGQIWCSPERHGAMTGLMKAQIDWIVSREQRGEADSTGISEPFEVSGFARCERSRR